VKRKRLAIIICSFLAVVILGALLWPREREPEYYGVPLSSWLARCNSSNSVEAQGALEVVRQNATSALPFLVRWIQYEKPGWRMVAERRAWKFPAPILNNRCLRWLLDDRAEVRANAAMSGFQVLGPRAEAALPTLGRLAETTKLPQTSYRAWICFAYIVPPGGRTRCIATFLLAVVNS
jgi:hypothetical protein